MSSSHSPPPSHLREQQEKTNNDDDDDDGSNNPNKGGHECEEDEGSSTTYSDDDDIDDENNNDDDDDDNDNDAIDDTEDLPDDDVEFRKSISCGRRRHKDSIQDLLPFPFSPLTRPLSISDLESCVALENAAFPNPTARCSREKCYIPLLSRAHTTTYLAWVYCVFFIFRHRNYFA
ncbi:hypothetical protein F5Y09DRAFT_238411 [Xylaria sp. FL1042]|nr:hypothetical protein F5Y09DRAFT_238411 [Xylaria sp. FL1042]